MITSNEEITKYTNYDKIYIPSNYVNNNYRYILNGSNITIITNNNCYTQYQTQYCDCKTYNMENNIITKTYQCNANQNANNEIDFINISDDINYSNRITNYYVNNYIILFGVLIIALLLTQLLKKNSRKI